MPLSDDRLNEIGADAAAAKVAAEGAQAAAERIEKRLDAVVGDHDLRLRSVEKRVGVLWAVSSGLWSLAVLAFGAILKKLGVL